MGFVPTLKERVSSLCAVLVVDIMAKLEDTGHFVLRRICVETGCMRLAIVSVLQYSATQNAVFFSSILECTHST